jgi:hypothetical protein
MTEDIKHYSFDFEREANRLERFTGVSGKYVLFLDLHLNSAKKVNVLHTTGDNYSAQMEGKRSSILNQALKTATTYVPLLGDNSVGMQWQAGQWHRGGKTTGRAIFFYVNNSATMELGKKDQSLMNLFMLYHETAHTLDDHLSFTQGARPLVENVADAYAAMMFLKRFGQQAVPFLQKLSVWRVNYFATYGAAAASHFTSFTLDKIIADSAQEDFSQLSSEEMLKRASEYTRVWTPQIADLKKASAVFDRLKDETDPAAWLTQHTRLSGDAPDNIALYVAAKSALPALYPGLRAENAASSVHFNASQAKRLLKKAATIKLSALFNTAAVRASGASSVTVAAIITPRAATSRGLRR